MHANEPGGAPMPDDGHVPYDAQVPVGAEQAWSFLQVAVQEARLGLSEGGIPIGAALFHRDGTLLGRGHNRRVQDGDPSMHAETAAFRDAGRRRDYPDTVMVTTLSPCLYCSGLVRQFRIGGLVVGETTNFTGGHEELGHNGVGVTVLDDPECIDLLGRFIERYPSVWDEDIGIC
jgi:cytosine/creatinine deaminase